MKRAVVWGLQGLVAGASIALLQFGLNFTFPQATILVAILFVWWSVDEKLKTIQKDLNWLHTATNGLVLPRVTRIERRLRKVNVPEPEDGDEYDDWAMFCAVSPERKGEQ